MDANKAAIGALKDYLDRPDPGFAILIDAPWGAGKTHFVKQVTGCEMSKDYLYVSLNGVDSVDAFRRTIVSAQPQAQFMRQAETLETCWAKRHERGTLAV